MTKGNQEPQQDETNRENQQNDQCNRNDNQNHQPTFPIPACLRQPKLAGYEFYHRVLGSPKYVVAPMVDMSELAWRLLCRRHGAQLCYTPMFHSSCFAKDVKYRKDAIQSCPEDRPLILQFCGNDPKILLEAALLAQDHCDAIDINLGCPQAIAKRGHYGAFLQDEWSLLGEIVSTLHQHLSVPVTCKIRVFDDVNKTIRYAQMLERAGAQLLTVHGRTRDQKGPLTGVADWKIIKKVRESVKIPMFANGNICCIRDVDRCIELTGVDGVMSAEGNLQNPFIFEGVSPTVWEAALEYLELLDKYPAPVGYVRGHMFKMFNHLLVLKSNATERNEMALAHSNDEFRAIVRRLSQKYIQYHEGLLPWDEEKKSEEGVAEAAETAAADNCVPDYNLKIPPWICQPYYRLPPEEHKQMMEEKLRLANERGKRQYYDKDGNEISRKQLKKLKRLEKRAKAKSAERRGEMCGARKCSNTKGLKCEFHLCRHCCRNKCLMEIVNCNGHKIFTETSNKNSPDSEKMDDDADDDEQAEESNENGQQQQMQQQQMVCEVVEAAD